MLYRTHKAGGALAMMVAFEYFRQHNMLATGLNEYVQLLIMYPASSWGATAPDLDHHWGSVKEKTPFNKLVHFFLHKTNPKHRSWQTHSLSVTGGFCTLMFALVSVGDHIWGGLGSADWVILRLIVVGVLVGIVSHLILDAMSTAGIHTLPGMKIRVVPQTSFFGTGSKWETFVYYICITLAGLLALNIFLSQMGLDVVSHLRVWVPSLWGG